MIELPHAPELPEPQILTEELGMKEDLTVSNTHLGIMTAAVVVGLVGQFWPWGTDEGWLGVAICVVLYFGLSHALTLYQSLVEGDCIFTSIPVSQLEHV